MRYTVCVMMPFSTSTLNICAWHPATRISRVPLEVKFMHIISLNSALLYADGQPLPLCTLSLSAANIRQVPLCESAAVGIVDALFRDGENPLLGEEELLDGAIGRRMSAVRGVAFEVRAVEGRDAPLRRCQSHGTWHGPRVNVLTWLFPVHSNSCVVSKANVDMGTAGRCGPGGGN